MGMVDAVRGAIGSLTGAIGDAIQSAIGAATSLLDENSPSKVFWDIGRNLVLGFVKGVDDLASLPAVSVGVMTQGAIDTGYAAPARQIASPVPPGGGVRMEGRNGIVMYNPQYTIVAPDAESLLSQLEMIALGGAA